LRDYGVVSPQFWIGDTGKSLRGDMPAQIVALYLMTSPHANMIGVFYCPLDTIAKETGMSLEGASEALQRLIEAQFCTFDAKSEEVFVHRMAAFQIGEQLEAKDNRCKGVARELERVMAHGLKAAFRALYSVAFHLPEPAPKAPPGAPPTEAPPKPLRSQKQEQKKDQEQGEEASPAAPPDPRGSRLPSDWTLPETWREWAERERSDLDVDKVADGFRDFWVSKPGKDGRKSDWQATWRNWIRSQKAVAGGRGANPSVLAGAV
jgi:hypothetical protein